MAILRWPTTLKYLSYQGFLQLRSVISPLGCLFSRQSLRELSYPGGILIHIMVSLWESLLSTGPSPTRGISGLPSTWSSPSNIPRKCELDGWRSHVLNVNNVLDSSKDGLTAKPEGSRATLNPPITSASRSTVLMLVRVWLKGLHVIYTWQPLT